MTADFISCPNISISFFKHAFRVGNICEKQRMSRRRRSCPCPVFGFDDSPEVLDGSFAAPHVEQSSHDGAHHIAQETIGSNRKFPYLAFLFPAGMGNAAVVGLYVGMKFAETGKVGMAVQFCASCMHGLKIEAAVQAANHLVVERVFLCRYIIMVCARQGIEPERPRFFMPAQLVPPTRESWVFQAGRPCL